MSPYMTWPHTSWWLGFLASFHLPQYSKVLLRLSLAFDFPLSGEPPSPPWRVSVKWLSFPDFPAKVAPSSSLFLRTSLYFLHTFLTIWSCVLPLFICLFSVLPWECKFLRKKHLSFLVYHWIFLGCRAMGETPSRSAKEFIVYMCSSIFESIHNNPLERQS